VFEQSILLDHNANKPWNFLASLSAELVVVSLVLLIPLAFSDHLPAVHWKDIMMSPPPAPPPIEVAPSRNPASGTNVLHETVTRRPFIFDRDAKLPQQQRASIALEGDAPPSIGVYVPGAVGPAGALPIITPTLPPPPKPETHPATQTTPIRVASTVQMAKLIRKVIPEYPILARTSRVSGVVHLVGTIAKDGTIRNLQLVDGNPLLTRAALDAVAQWVYEPTLLNGQPVEVIAPIEVNFTLGR